MFETILKLKMTLPSNELLQFDEKCDVKEWKSSSNKKINMNSAGFEAIEFIGVFNAL